MPMARTWNGMTIIEKKNRATGRAIVAIGMQVAADGKRITHRISGTLARSIHAAAVGLEHDDRAEEAAAAGGADLLMMNGLPRPSFLPGFGAAIEVGSWLPYACVEWEGRKHPGITQAVEGVRGARSDAIVRQAFREERL